MKRITLSTIILLFAAFSVFGDHHDLVPTSDSSEAAYAVPDTESMVLEFQTRGALTLDIGIFDPLAEVKVRFEGPEKQLRYRALTLGSYVRIHKNVKVGGFYRLQAGVRYDDDWVLDEAEWIWQDTRRRLEHLFIFDVSPRFHLSFLPGRNWVLMLKNRYHYNTFNNHQSLLVRPGITYFLMPSREPLLNFSLQYGFYIPLNFGDSFIYEHAPYFNALYHLRKYVKLEMNFTFRSITWSTSEEVIEQEGEPYTLRSQAFIIGAGVLLQL